jgi:rubrerythrin
MTKAPIAILLFGLMSAAPVWSQTLTPDAEAALGSALQDERHAEAFYAAALAKFGDARPFSNIIEAERQHEAMLIGLYETYGVAVPENGYTTGALEAPLAPEALHEACKIGVEAEIANRDLYDATLLPAVAAYPDITRVMQRLRNASEENHLPAFQRCLNRG